jgi:hypothetical protein
MKPHHFLIVLLSLFTIGCGGSSLSSLTGTVTLDGKPLDTGTLQLIPDDNNAVKQPSGAMITDGKFEVPAKLGIPEGVYTVRISSLALSGTAPPPGFSVNNPNVVPLKNKPTDRIPADWNTASTHTIEVKKGKNKYNFNVTSK